MNTVINWLSIAGMVISFVLGFVLAIRAKLQFGFLAPLGFMCAVVLNKISCAAVIPLNSQLAGSVNHENFRQTVAKLTQEEQLFYLSLDGQVNSIWQLGAVFFMLCGLLDLKATNGAPTGVLRYVLIVGGTTLILFSVFYPSLMLSRLTR